MFNDLIYNAVFLIGTSLVIFGIVLSALYVNDSFVNPRVESVDTNYTLEHVVLAGNQVLIIRSLSALQEQRLCGQNEFVQDSNRLNEVPRGVIYSCFARAQ